ncbi:hypothetical protein GYMLUDRAFT_243626 [Collybiopsis luxurians FD-317 M1]|uniref:Methyltransferase domain-containing protein n=1 Tax=Collybiopsis luxurians FD-317 M1 TaxID=944289 RepID=A0A0D0BCN9_9AGAR|nr:hypothetical protein GYMLUDRAFT_243626 [Collybiopsis luxurians FD-317 M1]
MDELDHQRFYASEQYLLPADEVETLRLNAQHRMAVKAFEGKLSLAPLNFKSGDRILESAAGTGIWALEFFEQNRNQGVLLDIECIDISDRQFPRNYPSNVHLSIHSVTELPIEWNGTFSYAHQRLLVSALNDTLWRKAISELFRVLTPGGWVELVEIEGEDLHYDIGPFSTKLQAIFRNVYVNNGHSGALAAYLPPLLKETGFVDVQLESRRLLVGKSGENGYRSDELGKFFSGLKRNVLNGAGFGFVQTGEEYEEIVQGSVSEWDANSDKAWVAIYTILARKP